MEEFLGVAGIQLNHVPYKGGAEALQGVLGGHVDALADSSSWAPHVEAGKLRLLATWGEQRTARFKEDRKSTRLNSSHSQISYAVFCLKKKKTKTMRTSS